MKGVAHADAKAGQGGLVLRRLNFLRVFTSKWMGREERGPAATLFQDPLVGRPQQAQQRSMIWA